jgi:hypothetical protein
MRLRKRGKRTFDPLPDDETDDAPFPDCEACGRPLGLHGWGNPVVSQRNPDGTGSVWVALELRCVNHECPAFGALVGPPAQEQYDEAPD